MAGIDDYIQKDHRSGAARKHQAGSGLLSSKKFGLVFENHLPETLLYGLPVRVGDSVLTKTDPEATLIR